ncbi:MAG: glycosyltransferase family 9 protein [Flavobacteriaceae bacterium]|nr:glycosyltransferase family 9 protein [Flavobacteriaceae bacterium]
MKKPKHILVIRFSAMGDVAMTVPVIRALVSQNTGTKVTVVSRPFLKPLFAQIPNVDFFPADVDREFKGIFGLYRLSAQIRKLKIDVIADLHDVLRSKILRKFLFFNCQKIVVVDKGRNEKRALTRTDNKIFKQIKSTHERYADVFRKLGFSVLLDEGSISPKSGLLNAKLPDIKAGRKIGYAPFAQYEGKVYPFDLTEKVIGELSRNNENHIYLFGGGKREIEILESLEKKYPNTISCAGKFTFSEELALISNLDCMVSMDSANAHLAAMYGVKTITLWGATHPYAGFYPFNQPMEYALLPDLKKYPNIPCSIYGNKVCEGYEEAMRTIPAADVVDLTEKILR